MGWIMKPWLRWMAIALILTGSLLWRSGEISAQEPEKKPADFRLNLNLIQGTDHGRGEKYDRITKKLGPALDKVNQKFFRGMKEIQKPMLLQNEQTFPVVSDRLTIKVHKKEKDKYPIELAWKKSNGTTHVKMKIHLAPGKLFAVQGTPYQNGSLWAVLKIEEGTFYIEEQEKTAPSAPIPPLRNREPAGASSTR
jgi:hypothetical protein